MNRNSTVKNKITTLMNPVELTHIRSNMQSLPMSTSTRTHTNPLLMMKTASLILQNPKTMKFTTPQQEVARRRPIDTPILSFPVETLQMSSVIPENAASVKAYST